MLVNALAGLPTPQEDGKRRGGNGRGVSFEKQVGGVGGRRSKKAKGGHHDEEDDGDSAGSSEGDGGEGGRVLYRDVLELVLAEQVGILTDTAVAS